MRDALGDLLAIVFLGPVFLSVPGCLGASYKTSVSVQQAKSPKNSSDSIPKIVHQSWKTEEIPRRFKRWQQSWIEFHPDWEYILWTDDTNRRLVEEHYSWFLDMYNEFPTEILRADSVRYLYLYHFGGLYIDLDFLAVRNHEPLLRGRSLVLGSMSNDTLNPNGVPNAWMASAPGHPFWLFCIHSITTAWQAHKPSNRDKPYVENITGPMMLSRAIAAYKRNGVGDLTILPPGLVYPADWQDSHTWGSDPNEYRVCNPYHLGFDEVQCIGKFPDAFAVTFWTKSWDS